MVDLLVVSNDLLSFRFRFSLYDDIYSDPGDYVHGSYVISTYSSDYM